MRIIILETKHGDEIPVDQGTLPIAEAAKGKIMFAFSGVLTMDKQKALDTIEHALEALKSLEKALERDDRRVMSLELQTARTELKNLRQMIADKNAKIG